MAATNLQSFTECPIPLECIASFQTELLGEEFQGTPKKIYFINNKLWIRLVNGYSGHFVTLDIDTQDGDNPSVLTRIRLRKLHKHDNGETSQSRKDYSVEAVAETSSGDIVVTCEVSNNGSASSSDGNDGEASEYISLREIAPDGRVHVNFKGNFSDVCSHGDTIFALKKKPPAGEDATINVYYKEEVIGPNDLTVREWGQKPRSVINTHRFASSFIVSSNHLIATYGNDRSLLRHNRDQATGVFSTHTAIADSAKSWLCATDEQGSVLVLTKNDDRSTLRVLDHETYSFRPLNVTDGPESMTMKHATMDHNGHVYILYCGENAWAVYKAKKPE